MTLPEHPVWPALVAHLHLQQCGDGTAGAPRFRIEVRHSSELGRFLAVELACPACGERFWPVRQRRDGTGCYIGASCDWETNLACSRTQRVREAYAAIVEAVQGTPATLRAQQASLF